MSRLGLKKLSLLIYYYPNVERDQDEAKFWLSPVRLQADRGFNRTEINRIQKLVEEHQEELLEGWNDFFNG
ncbi:MAG: DUF4160 domain-containing protein [Gloeomargaritaceae cyanobacterium C42_A2020_066]|nr:DUF4160 domain-containing protein [Gloeomargaritaceae cyanobacterium C42_A2020_066]